MKGNEIIRRGQDRQEAKTNVWNVTPAQWAALHHLGPDMFSALETVKTYYKNQRRDEAATSVSLGSLAPIVWDEYKGDVSHIVVGKDSDDDGEDSGNDV